MESYFRQLAQLLPVLPFEAMERIADIVFHAVVNGSSIFVFGNGGSAASASHMMCDMNKGLSEVAGVPRVKLMALTDNVPLITALANDCGYEHVFSEQLKNFVQPGDVAFAISGSGRSPNIVLGLKTARDLGAQTMGVAGYQGGSMKALCDVCAVVPSEDIRLIEDVHHAVLHSILVAVRERLMDYAAAAPAQLYNK